MSDDPNTSSQDAASDASGKSQKSAAQQRIDQLVRRANESERNNQQLSEDNAQLLAHIATLTQKVEDLSRSRAPSASSAQDASPATPIGAPNTGNVDLESLVKGAVAAAIGEMVETQRSQTAAQSRLAATQKAYFQEAAKDMPALRDTNSEEFQLFEQVFEGMPEFRGSERGPLLAAEVVRGVISSARRGKRDEVNTKTQASLHRSDFVGNLQGDGSRQEKAMAAVEALHKKGVTQGLSPEELGAYVLAAQQTRPSGE